MIREEFIEIESYMLSQMRDSAHDRFHIDRVLYAALDIAETEEYVDMDVLITACLLHDIGREKQSANLELCHAQIGSEMAYEYLLSKKWNIRKAQHIKECIGSHRYRGNNAPQSIEAKILFDADKLDAVGALGIARTLIYEGQVSEPLCIFDENDNIVTDGGGAEISSFFQEYDYKLKNIYGNFYTKRAEKIASERKKAAVDFHESLYREIDQTHRCGVSALNNLLDE